MGELNYPAVMKLVGTALMVMNVLLRMVGHGKGGAGVFFLH